MTLSHILKTCVWASSWSRANFYISSIKIYKKCSELAYESLIACGAQPEGVFNYCRPRTGSLSPNLWSFILARKWVNHSLKTYICSPHRSKVLSHLWFFSQVTSWIFFKNKVHFWTSNLHDIPVFNFINYKTRYRMPCNYWNQMNYSFKGGFQFSKIIKIWFNL